MSSSYGPFVTRAGVLQRSTDFIDLMVRNNQEADAYRLWAANSVNNAYGNLTDGGAGSGVGGAGPTLLLTAEKDQIARSVRAARAGAAAVVENRKGHTSFQVDMQDYPALGPDEHYTYVRVQERRMSTGGWLTVAGVNNNGLPILGPILIVPPRGFFSGGPAGTFTVVGTAPSNTGNVAGNPATIDETVQVPLPMHIVFPRPASAMVIRNDDAAGDLLVSYGVGMPLLTVGQGSELVPGLGHGQGTIRELFLAREAGNGGCDFSLDVQIDFAIAM